MACWRCQPAWSEPGGVLDDGTRGEDLGRDRAVVVRVVVGHDSPTTVDLAGEDMEPAMQDTNAAIGQRRGSVRRVRDSQPFGLSPVGSSATRDRHATMTCRTGDWKRSETPRRRPLVVREPEEV